MRACANCGNGLEPKAGIDVTDDSEESRFYCDLVCLLEKEPDHPLVAELPERAKVRAALHSERRTLRRRFEEAGVPW